MSIGILGILFSDQRKNERRPILMNIITLLDDYVRGLLEAEEVFLADLGQFTKLEQTVSDLSRRMAADFLSLVLTNADEMIRSSGLQPPLPRLSLHWSE